MIKQVLLTFFEDHFTMQFIINLSMPRRKSWNFADNIFKCIFLNEKGMDLDWKVIVCSWGSN